MSTNPIFKLIRIGKYCRGKAHHNYTIILLTDSQYIYYLFNYYWVFVPYIQQTQLRPETRRVRKSSLCRKNIELFCLMYSNLVYGFNKLLRALKKGNNSNTAIKKSKYIDLYVFFIENWSYKLTQNGGINFDLIYIIILLQLVFLVNLKKYFNVNYNVCSF